MSGINSIVELEKHESGLYTLNGKDVWKVTSWCEHPTVTLRCIQTGEVIRGAIGCSNVQGFVPLVPKEKIKPYTG